MNRKGCLAAWVLAAMVGLGSGSTASPDRAVSGLKVVSQPAATLIVDGEPRGETPLTVELAPGEHQLLLVKAGYRTITQKVDLAPDEMKDLSFSLEPSSTQAGAADEKGQTAAPTETLGKKKGSKLKWIVPAVVVAGGGTAAAVVVSNKNGPPTAGPSVAPTGTGMAGATVFRFEGGQSSDPDGDRLSYAWNFGDGATGYGQSLTHLYTAAGTYSVSLTVYDGKESATANATAKVNRTLAGVWTGTIRDNYTNTFAVTISLNQSGASLSGTYADESGAGSAHGSVSGTDFVCPCRVSLTIQQAGYQSFTMSGDVNATVSTMSVSVTGSGFRGEAFTLTRTSG